MTYDKADKADEILSALAGSPAEGPIIRTVIIAELVRDPSYQVRDGLDGGTITSYANLLSGGGRMPPIKVALVSGEPMVVDGWHRIAAHERLGRAEIEAEFSTATERAARWLAASANLTHGLPLKSKEVRQVFKALIASRKHVLSGGNAMSYREITEAIGGTVGHTTVRNWMQKDFPKIAAKMGDGERITKREGSTTDTEAGRFNSTFAAIEAGRQGAKGVRDPVRRRKLIAAAEEALAEMKGDHAWNPIAGSSTDF